MKDISAHRCIAAVRSPRPQADVAGTVEFAHIVRLARRLFAAPWAMVYLDHHMASGTSDSGAPLSAATSDDIRRYAQDQREPVLISDASRQGKACPAPFFASYPIRSGDGHHLGALCVIDHRPHQNSDNDLVLLGDLSRMVEQIIASNQLATLDELTGLTNRRGFLLLAENALKTAQRRRQELAVLALDLDHFKQINDHFGHAQGDLALQDFAYCLSQTCRSCDVIGRLGGDEFWVLLTPFSQASLPSFGRRLLAQLQRHCRRHKRAYRLTYSLGCAWHRGTQGASLPRLMAEADRLMYRHKQRNRESCRGDQVQTLAQLGPLYEAIQAHP